MLVGHLNCLRATQDVCRLGDFDPRSEWANFRLDVVEPLTSEVIDEGNKFIRGPVAIGWNPEELRLIGPDKFDIPIYGEIDATVNGRVGVHQQFRCLGTNQVRANSCESIVYKQKRSSRRLNIEMVFCVAELAIRLLQYPGQRRSEQTNELRREPGWSLSGTSKEDRTPIWVFGDQAAHEGIEASAEGTRRRKLSLDLLKLGHNRCFDEHKVGVLEFPLLRQYIVDNRPRYAAHELTPGLFYRYGIVRANVPESGDRAHAELTWK